MRTKTAVHSIQRRKGLARQSTDGTPWWHARSTAVPRCAGSRFKLLPAMEGNQSNLTHDGAACCCGLIATATCCTYAPLALLSLCTTKVAAPKFSVCPDTAGAFVSRAACAGRERAYSQKKSVCARVFPFYSSLSPVFGNELRPYSSRL